MGTILENKVLQKSKSSKNVNNKKDFYDSSQSTIIAYVDYHSYIIIFLFFRHQSEKRIRQLPEIDGLSKDTVVTSWMAKYDALMKGKY